MRTILATGQTWKDQELVQTFVPTGKEIYEFRKFTAVKVLDCGLVGYDILQFCMRLPAFSRN